MKVNLFTFAILLQLSLCIIATSQVNTTTDQVTTDKLVAVTTAATTVVDVTTGVTGKVNPVTKKPVVSVTTVLPVKETHETFKKVNKKLKKDAKKSSRARKMKALSTEKPDDVDFDDTSAEDEESLEPRVSHHARGHKKAKNAAMKSRRHWSRSGASFRSRNNRHRNKPLASWRSEEVSSPSDKGSSDGGDCASTIECIMKNIDPKEFCCKDDKPGNSNERIVPDPDPKSENPSGAPSGPPATPGRPAPPPPSQPAPSPMTNPPPPPPPPQMCECTCPEDGSKVSITRAQFDSLKSSAAYRSALMNDAYHWNPYSAYNQMPYGMARGPYAYGR